MFAILSIVHISYYQQQENNDVWISILSRCLLIAKSKRTKVTMYAEKFAAVLRHRRQSRNERQAIPPSRRKVSASSVDSLHEQGRRTVRWVFAFRECEEKVPGKFTSFHPRAGRCTRHRCRRLRRIDSSKGNSYPLTGRNSLRGEILNRGTTHTTRPVDLQDTACETGVSRPPTLLEINACPSQ